jgi:hypothetical protein
MFFIQPAPHYFKYGHKYPKPDDERNDNGNPFCHSRDEQENKTGIENDPAQYFEG